MSAAADPEQVIESVELRAAIPTAALEELSPLFWLLSPNGVLTEDASTLGSTGLAAEITCVSLYVAAAEVEGALQTLAAATADLGLQVAWATAEIAKQDWNRVWKQHFVAFNVGKRLRVEPAWLQQPDEANLIRLVIDPGLAFGTGTHETTRLMLCAVEQWAELQMADLAQKTVLDIGTGSAILAILAVKLGAKRAVATEVERDAVVSAAENLRLNGVSEPIELLHTDDPRSAKGQFDLVIANIISSILIPLRDAILAKLAPGGTLLLSGILHREGDAVIKHYSRATMRHIRSDRDGDWLGIVFYKGS